MDSFSLWNVAASCHVGSPPAIVWTFEDGENPPELTEIMVIKAPGLGLLERETEETWGSVLLWSLGTSTYGGSIPSLGALIRGGNARNEHLGRLAGKAGS